MRWDEVAGATKCPTCQGVIRFDADDFLQYGYGDKARSVRPGQVTMGRAVEHAIWNHEILLAEAPVGSGKSAAVGVPAMVLGAARKAYSLTDCEPPPYKRLRDMKKFTQPRVVISTAKKNLQEQYAKKELPYLLKRLDSDAVTVAVLKGKSNYACQLKADSLEGSDRTEFDKWFAKFPDGDLVNAPEPRPSFLFDVDAGDCLGRSCPYAEEGTCGFWAAKEAAKAASIIVTNHAVVAWDLRFGPAALLPAYTTLVLDEGHAAADAFRGAFSRDLGANSAKRLLRKLSRLGVAQGVEAPLNTAWDALFLELNEHPDGALPVDVFGPVAKPALSALTAAKEKATQAAAALGWRSGDDWNISEVNSSSARRDILTALGARRSAEELAAALQKTALGDPNTVMYAETSDRGRRKVVVAPVSIGPLVGPRLQQIPSLIVTSATLATGGTFNDIKNQLGLGYNEYRNSEGESVAPRPLKEITLPTPFNLAKQAVLYAPRHTPLPAGPKDPARAAYIEAVVKECAALATASQGNAFVLCTAHQDVKELAPALAAATSLDVIAQGADNTAPLRKYLATPNSVLVATKAFWEGVDIPGQKLRLVIIVKLPFPTVTDPVMQARQRQYVTARVAKGALEKDANADAFEWIQVPRMLTDLRQGAGRLIRSNTDRGVLAILDPRLYTGNSSRLPAPEQKTFAGYGRKAVAATGFTNITPKLDVVTRVLRAMAEQEEKEVA